jgi:glycosyltransferase involved in cell wall biosynthesis
MHTKVLKKNTMKKIKLIYDVSVILLGEKYSYARTGIYFCSYNILKKLRCNPLFDIYLFAHDKQLIPISKNTEVFKGLTFIKLNDHDISSYKNNISFHLKTIINSKNIFLKFLCLLKIIKNVLYLSFNTIFRNIYNISKKRKLKKIDAFFCLYYYFPQIINNYNIKKFILIYDMLPILFPNHYSEELICTFKNIMTRFVDKETYFFTISECTKRDFIKYFGENLDKSKITVTYISSANDFESKYDKQAIKYIENKYKVNTGQNKYIFSFCLLDHRKNLIFTVKCFVKFIQKNNINDLCFLLGGIQYENFSKLFNNTMDEFPENYRSKIIRLGYVDDADVNLLYSNSLFFTFISQYEGFGMPLLEAMQAGTPVISSNNSSLPEVVGDAAITIDYDDEEACISAMEKYYFNEDLRQAYIKKGFERAKLFSWDKTVDLMINKIKEVIQAQ